jgi:hypothetical protein
MSSSEEEIVERRRLKRMAEMGQKLIRCEHREQNEKEEHRICILLFPCLNISKRELTRYVVPKAPRDEKAEAMSVVARRMVSSAC